MVEAECELTHSVILATFDLEEVGIQGSYEFIQRFLVPQMRKFGQKRISGAVIIDTVMNWNGTEFSQTIKEEMAEKLPEVVEYLEVSFGFSLLFSSEN